MSPPGYQKNIFVTTAYGDGAYKAVEEPPILSFRQNLGVLFIFVTSALVFVGEHAPCSVHLYNGQATTHTEQL